MWQKHLAHDGAATSRTHWTDLGWELPLPTGRQAELPRSAVSGEAVGRVLLESHVQQPLPPPQGLSLRGED